MLVSKKGIHLTGLERKYLQSSHFHCDCLYPCHEQRILSIHPIDDLRRRIHNPHIRLVEHKGIPVQSKKMLRIDFLCLAQDIAERPVAPSHAFPFLHNAVWEVAVEVDGCCPSPDDDDSVVSVCSDGGGEGVE